MNETSHSQAIRCLCGCALLFFASAPILWSQTIPEWNIGPFTRPAGNPIIAPLPQITFRDPIIHSTVHWQSLHTFNPAAIVRNGKIYVLYRAEDDSGDMAIGHHTSRLGLAESLDGIHFRRRKKPVFFPALDDQHDREWPGGVEDPRIVESPEGMYVLTYTQWNRKLYTVGIATSMDLLHWKKWGTAFDESSGIKLPKAYKSAGILTELLGDRLIAAKLSGKYWMYWGEGAIHLATSQDLIHWVPIVDANGGPVEVLRPRIGHFDSTFPEVGPPPVLTSAGIVMIYNGKNAEAAGDPALGANAYAAGEALFSKSDPGSLVDQDQEPVLQPTLPYEKSGQYAAGTTFAEGLVFFHQQWMLYYGCADSLVAVVVAPAKKNQ